MGHSLLRVHDGVDRGLVLVYLHSVVRRDVASRSHRARHHLVPWHQGGEETEEEATGQIHQGGRPDTLLKSLPGKRPPSRKLGGLFILSGNYGS